MTWQRVLRKAIDAEVAAGRLTDALPRRDARTGCGADRATIGARRRARTLVARRRCAIGWRARSGVGSRRRACGRGRAGARLESTGVHARSVAVADDDRRPRRARARRPRARHAGRGASTSCPRCSTPNVRSLTSRPEGSRRRLALGGAAPLARRGGAGPCRLATRAPRHRQQRDEPMFATARQVRGWVLVEVRGAWGEDAIHASAFGEHVPQHWKDELKRRHIRAVCIRSHERAEATDVRLYACAARRPATGPAPLWRRDVASLADVVAAVDDLRVDRSTESTRVGARRPTGSSSCARTVATINAARTSGGRSSAPCASRGGPTRCGSAHTSAATDSPPTSSCCPTASTSGAWSRTRRPRPGRSRRRTNRALALPRAHVASSLEQQAVEHFVRRETRHRRDRWGRHREPGRRRIVPREARGPPRQRPRATPNGLGRRTAHLQRRGRPAGPPLHARVDHTRGSTEPTQVSVVPPTQAEAPYKRFALALTAGSGGLQRSRRAAIRSSVRRSLSGLADVQIGDRRLVGVRDRSRSTSPRGRPISCMPIGSPRSSKPTGTLIAGSPANVA